MRAWSFPLGKPFGVDLRMHGLFLALLFVSSISTSADGLGGWRGVGLWLLLLFAVCIRETARGLTAATLHVGFRSILLLPIGGLQTPADQESETEVRKPLVQLRIALAGIFANLLAAGLLAALIKGGSPRVPLLAHPWIGPSHLLEAAVWLNLLLAGLHLLPIFPLDAGRLLRDFSIKRHGFEEATRASISLGRMLGLAAAGLGIGLLFLPNDQLASDAGSWLLLCGFFVAAGAQIDDQGTIFQSVVDKVFMREVMLTTFTTISPSDTLQDALDRFVHSLQEEFPVVRNNEIVGVVTRGSILMSLRAHGNGYVQSVMVRNFLIAGPDETLGAAIRRMRQGRIGMIPVANEEGRVVGLVTLENLRNSVVPLLEQRKLRATTPPQL